jgi:hypothetical protein
MEKTMGYDLISKSDGCHFSIGAWPWVLSLAFAFGWRPEGTEAPTIGEVLVECDPYSDWKGGYFSNDFQGVTEPDATAIGEALHRALETARKARDGDFEARADLGQRLAKAEGLLKSPQAEVDPLFEDGKDEPAEPALFDPGVETKIRAFADMALRGSFLIG